MPFGGVEPGLPRGSARSAGDHETGSRRFPRGSRQTSDPRSARTSLKIPSCAAIPSYEAMLTTDLLTDIPGMTHEAPEPIDDASGTFIST